MKTVVMTRATAGLGGVAAKRSFDTPNTRLILGTLSLAFGLGGCFGAPRYHGPVSDHFDGHAFQNQTHFEQHGLGDFLRWQLSSGAIEWPDWVNVPHEPPPPTRVSSGVRVTFINHATVLVQMAGLNILTDPVWSPRVGPLSWLGPRRHKAPGLSLYELPHIDVIVLSHNHYDHLDVPTLKQLWARDSRGFLRGSGRTRS
jgi:hypothetical protein